MRGKIDEQERFPVLLPGILEDQQKNTFNDQRGKERCKELQHIADEDRRHRDAAFRAAPVYSRGRLQDLMLQRAGDPDLARARDDDDAVDVGQAMVVKAVQRVSVFVGGFRQEIAPHRYVGPFGYAGVPACGNGIEQQREHRRVERSALLIGKVAAAV